jgi:hypothetical protein
LTGADPAWLDFDSTVTTYPELGRLHRRGVWFVTIRRRGTAVVRRPRPLPARSWREAVLDTPTRWHRPIRFAGRTRAEDGLGTAGNFFPLDCLAGVVRLHMDLDAALTVRANGCYRWPGKQLKGFEKAAPQQLYRRIVAPGGVVAVGTARIVVSLDRRSPNPILREAALDRGAPAIPWLQDRKIHFVYT